MYDTRIAFRMIRHSRKDSFCCSTIRMNDIDAYLSIYAHERLFTYDFLPVPTENSLYQDYLKQTKRRTRENSQPLDRRILS